MFVAWRLLPYLSYALNIKRRGHSHLEKMDKKLSENVTEKKKKKVFHIGNSAYLNLLNWMVQDNSR